MSGRQVVTAALGLALVSAPAAADVTLYAAAKGVREGSAPSSFYTIDPETAEATLIGPIEGPDPLGEGTRAYENVTGLAFLRDDRLVATADGDDFVPAPRGIVAGRGAILIEIDPATGAAEFIGLIDDDVNGTCGRMPGLSYDPDSGTLYGIGNSCIEDFEPECMPEEPPDPDDDYLYSIDPVTGAGTPIGVIQEPVEDGNPNDEFTPCPITSADGNGLAVEGPTGTLFAARGRSLVTIDPTTVLATRIEPRNLDKTGALDFDPEGGDLYGATLANDGTTQNPIFVPVLNIISTGNAASTRVGETTLDGAELAGVDAIVFRGPGGCPAGPIGLPCRGPGKSRLSFKSPSGKLKWKWSRGAVTTLDDWGDPVSGDTRYRLCWYDHAEGVARLDTVWEVPPGEGWKGTSKGFKYKRPSGSPPGIDKLRLKSGVSGTAKIVAKGKDLPPPVLPQSQTPAVQVQLLNGLGECWETVVGAPAGTNDGKSFKDDTN